MNKILIPAISAFIAMTPLSTARAETESYLFTATPSDAQLTIECGGTIGWGYAITNQSTRYWLLPTALNSDSFAFSEPNSLFDFPVLSPGSSASQAYDPGQKKGLYELKVNMECPVGYTNYGRFTLTAEWWSGDPLKGGTKIGPAPDVEAKYFVTATEPKKP